MNDNEFKEYIKKMVTSNPRWAERAVTVLYQRQTEDEQLVQTTVHENGMGFSGIDATILSSFAQQLAQGRRLSPKQLDVCYKRLGKYARQLLQITLANSDKE